MAAQIADAMNVRLYPGAVGRETGMQVVAIEEDETRFQQLSECLTDYTRRHNSFVFVRKGALGAKMLAGIRKHAPHDPMLFFLDPFGISGLDGHLLPKLLSEKHSELLILFSDEGAVRLFGKATARAQDPEAKVTAAEQQRSLFGMADDIAAVAAARRASTRVVAGHKSNPRAKEILDRAFADVDYRAVMERTPEVYRQKAMIDLYTSLLKRSGAPYVLEFAISTDEGRHKYTMLHASKEVRARAVMKDAMHRTRNRMGLAGPTLITDTPLDEIVELLRMRFAGQQVRWTGDIPSVRKFALDETELWQHEFEALRGALEPFVITERPLRFQF